MLAPGLDSGTVRRSARGLLLGLLALPVLFAVPVLALAAITVTDATGHVVRLAQPARRIVALTPHLVENLYAAGAGARLVGAEADADYPPAARALPSVGGYDSLSVEAIVARRPDLVVAWAQSGTQDLVARLRALGIPVYVDDPRHLADIATEIENFGRLAGTEAVARRAAARFRQRIEALRAKYAQRRPVSLFYEVWDRPLQTLSSRGLIGDVIALCGGRNVFADAPGLAPRVSIESVLARDPVAIVAAGAARGGRDWRAFWRQWPMLRAVARRHLIAVPPDLLARPTVRLAGGAAMLCQWLEAVRRDSPVVSRAPARHPRP